MINLSRNFLRAFLRRAFSADGLFSRGGRSRLSRRRSPKKRRIAFAGEEGGAFMIFCGLGKECGLSRVLRDRRRRAASVAVSSGRRGAVSPSFFAPENRGGGRTSAFAVADGGSSAIPRVVPFGDVLGGRIARAAASAKCAACRRRAGRRAERPALCTRAFRSAPAACNLFRRSAFLRAAGERRRSAFSR